MSSTHSPLTLQNCDDFTTSFSLFLKKNMLHFSSQKLLIYSEESFFLTQKKNLCLLYSACMLSRFSCVHLFVTSWTTAHQALLSMGFSRQEYWSRLPFLPPGNLPNPGIKPVSLNSPALASSFFTTSVIWEALGPILWYSTAAWRFRNWPFLTCHSLARVFSLKEGKQKNSVF